ncbi:MAG: hypothetical protein AB7K09_25585 [Planctomycetota bacterium]
MQPVVAAIVLAIATSCGPSLPADNRATGNANATPAPAVAPGYAEAVAAFLAKPDADAFAALARADADRSVAVGKWWLDQLLPLTRSERYAERRDALAAIASLCRTLDGTAACGIHAKLGLTAADARIETPEQAEAAAAHLAAWWEAHASADAKAWWNALEKPTAH